MTFEAGDGYLEWVDPSQVLRVEAWGADSVRVRAARNAVRDHAPGALLAPAGAPAQVSAAEETGRLVNGRLTVEVSGRRAGVARVKLAVSIWPTVNPESENFDPMRRAGYLVGATGGGRTEQQWPEKGDQPWVRMSYHDASNPDARRFLWKRVKESYYDHGVRVWWLDACEPDLEPERLATAEYAAGPGPQVGNAYPLWHAQGFYEGMREAGETEIVLLIRSAWAGQPALRRAVVVRRHPDHVRVARDPNARRPERGAVGDTLVEH